MTVPLIVRAARCEAVARTPVWLMRQAGRYLPEYKQVRARVTFEEAIADADVAAELTLQPVRRFGVDGAVVFSDIMAPLGAMGVQVAFAPGPVLEPLVLDDRLGGLHVAEGPFATAAAIRRVRAELGAGERPGVIGFCGAPVTLAAYLLEGGGSKDFLALRVAAGREPERLHRLLDTLSDGMSCYLAAQVDAGADILQIFDSWAGVLSVTQYEDFAAEPTRRLVAAARATGVPVVYFAPAAHHLARRVARLGADVVGVDWRRPLGAQWAELPPGTAIQGNVDPAALLAGPAAAASAARKVLAEAAGRPGHILNLGHGVDQHTPVEAVAALVTATRAVVPCAT